MPEMGKKERGTLELADIAQRLEVDLRLVRYVVDHHLVRGVSGHGRRVPRKCAPLTGTVDVAAGDLVRTQDVEQAS